MSENHKLSIIVPVYNGEKTIGACVESITGQSYSDLEIVIIDDGSKDNTYKICSSIAANDNRIVFIRQENKGVSAARNKGIETATGKYVMFIDCDDTIDSKYCESFMNHSRLADDGLMVISRISVATNETSSTITEGDDFPSNSVLSKDKLVDIWDSHIWNPPFNKLYILQIIKNNNIRFNESYRIGEDWLFNNAYARALKPEGYYIPSESYYNYYLDPDPWRHCKPEEFYYINKNQVDDFKRTIVELELSEESVWKFDKRDMDFTISEIRRIVRNGEKAGKARKLYSEERIKARIKEHRADFSKMDVLEFSSGSVLFIYLWENTRKIYGKVRSRLNG